MTALIHAHVSIGNGRHRGVGLSGGRRIARSRAGLKFRTHDIKILKSFRI